MRLLRTDSAELVLETFIDESKVPPYAILSHTWLKDDDEITFSELGAEGLRQKEGWAKLDHSRKQAAKDGLDYVWIDTCCIDKSSSAELAEAINSMFRWYEKSTVCYVYLEDFAIRCASNEDGKGRANLLLSLQQCRWFTRGWTLQELLAPKQLNFYSNFWYFLGSLDQMAPEVSQITRVHIPALTKERSIFSYSVAQRMYWASNRRTTRLEDGAYSLLGILDVSLAIIYGEGQRAFRRLQEEILRTSSDQSIFVFQHDRPTSKAARWLDLLAETPAAFAGSGNVVAFPNTDYSSCQLIGAEVRFKLPSLRSQLDVSEIQPILDCGLEDDTTKSIVLNAAKTSNISETFCRSANRPGFEIVDTYSIAQPLSKSSFSMALNAWKLESAGPNVERRILVCRCANDFYSLTAKVISGAIWKQQNQTFEIDSSYPQAELILHSKQSTKVITMRIFRDFSEDGGGPSIAFEDFSFRIPWIDFSAARVLFPRNAATWHKNGLLIARISELRRVYVARQWLLEIEHMTVWQAIGRLCAQYVTIILKLVLRRRTLVGLLVLLLLYLGWSYDQWAASRGHRRLHRL